VEFVFHELVQFIYLFILCEWLRLLYWNIPCACPSLAWKQKHLLSMKSSDFCSLLNLDCRKS